VEGSEIEKYFKQFKVDKLPTHRAPLFKIGDLVSAQINSGNLSDSFYIKSGLGVVVEICFYQCTDYNFESEEDPWYIIEYKLHMTKENCYRYFSEEFLKLEKGECDD